MFCQVALGNPSGAVRHGWSINHKRLIAAETLALEPMLGGGGEGVRCNVV